jgi:hypothetical protein
VCKLLGVGYYYTDASPRSNAGGRGGVSKNVRVPHVADNVRMLHEGGECITPPPPFVKTPHIPPRMVRHEDASHGTTCATPPLCQLAQPVPLADLPPMSANWHNLCHARTWGQERRRRERPPVWGTGAPPLFCEPLRGAYRGTDDLFRSAQRG